MLCVAGTIFSSVFCFLFADKAAEYVEKYYECIRAITGDRFGALKIPTCGCALGCLLMMLSCRQF
jgi:hypothetical protein